METKNKHIFVINGMGGCGKDTFVRCIQNQLTEEKVWNFSSADKAKEMAAVGGWTGGKSDKDRKYISDLKALSDEYCDLSFMEVSKKIEEFRKSDSAIALFIHIRENYNIERVVKEFNTLAVLVVNNNVKDITTNKSDAGVYNYNYDITINNNGTLDDLTEQASNFINEYIHG